MAFWVGSVFWGFVGCCGFVSIGSTAFGVSVGDIFSFPAEAVAFCEPRLFAMAFARAKFFAESRRFEWSVSLNRAAAWSAVTPSIVAVESVDPAKTFIEAESSLSHTFDMSVTKATIVSGLQFIL